MKKTKLNLLFSFLAFLLPIVIFGQTTIKGKLTDAETGEGLIGANVVIKGTTFGTITNFDGSYSIDVPDDQDILIYSYIGYESQEINIRETKNYDVSLSVGSVLDEVLVIGYGKVKKEDATGSIVEVSKESFNKGAITSPQDLLAGKVAGVQVTSNGGEAGGGSTIRIRGGSSLSASNDPLIVIDGIPVDNDNVSGSRNTLNVINPNDIETFTVLKDASATAIYGSRASNGVILITTKKGSQGKPKIDYNGFISFSSPLSKLDVMSGDEFRTLINERYPSDSNSDTRVKDALGTENTNWQDEIYRTAFGHDHNISISGAAGDFPYRVSVGYSDKQGLIKTDRFKRTSGSVNLSPGFFDNKLQVNLSLKGILNNNVFTDGGAVGSAVAFDPTQPVRSDGGPYGGYFTWLQNNGDPITIATANPVSLLEQKSNSADIRRFLGSMSLNYRFAPRWRANLNLAVDRAEGEGESKSDANMASRYDIADPDGGGEMNRYDGKNQNDLIEFYLNYDSKLGKSKYNKLDLVAGYSEQNLFFERNFFNSNIAVTDTSSDMVPKELYLLSFYGRANLNLGKRLLLTGTLRADASSRFSKETRWGYFPAAAIAYKIVDGNNEAALSSLKLRVGWGITGQQDVGGFYDYIARYRQSFNNASYQIGDTFINTYRPEAYDANLKWEETTTYNVGFDYGLKKERIYGSLELYLRETNDLLNFIPIAIGSNLANAINTNVGDMRNTGVEFSINADVIQSAQKTWTVGYNITYNQNEITKLTATDDPDYLGVVTGGISGGVGNNVQIHSVGHPKSSYFVFEQVYDDAGKPVEGEYVDRNEDGMITDEDKYHFKSPDPSILMGLTSSFNWKGIDISLAGRANLGHYIYNNALADLGNYDRLASSTGYLSNVHGRTEDVGFESPEYFSDYYVEKGSFFRLDHITIGYDFGRFFNFASRFNVYATAQNPLLLTGYTGLDPEISGGIDNNVYPRSRTYLVGLNLSF